MKLKERLKNLYVNFTQLRWTVGVADFDPDAILDPDGRLKIHWVRHHNKSSWFADPFILSVTDEYVFILVEEFVYSRNRGRISRLKINRHTWKLEQIEPIIEQKIHMSFPAYFRKGGKVYIYPESTLSGKLSLFEYDEESGKAAKLEDISDRPLADAVILDMDGRKTIMATTAPNDSGKKLDFYPYPSFESGPANSVLFDTKVARNAGFLFKAKGRIIRPAQDCTKYYGSCVVLQELVEEEGKISFKEVRRFHSSLFNYSHAFHTFNVFENNYIAVDAEGFKYGLIAQAVFSLREMLRRK